MKRFATSYAAIVVVAFVVQVAGAFVFGALERVRWNPGDSYTFAANTFLAGLEPALYMALVLILGSAFRFGAYVIFDRLWPGRRALWWVLAILEAIYAALNLLVAWGATIPDGDQVMAWIAAMMLAMIVIPASLAALVVALVLRWRARSTAPALA